jgi:hypothetical protein
VRRRFRRIQKKSGRDAWDTEKLLIEMFVHFVCCISRKHLSLPKIKHEVLCLSTSLFESAVRKKRAGEAWHIEQLLIEMLVHVIYHVHVFICQK